MPHGGNAKIGVLGGIGPEATGVFYTKLVQRIQEDHLVRSNEDFPQIIINSIPAPELVHDEISDSELEAYERGLCELDAFGVDFLVMVCNTIHLFRDKLQTKVKAPIINLRKEVEEYLSLRQIKGAFVIATPSTLRKGLYEFSGIKCVKPTDADMKELSTAIFEFNKGNDKQKQTEVVRRICEEHLANKEAEAVLLGCTELSVMLENESFQKVNTMDVLVEATVNKIKELQ